MKHNKLEDLNLLLTCNVDGFTPSGTLCYFKDKADSEAVMMMPTTLREVYNLRKYIQHLIPKCEYVDDDDDFDNPLRWCAYMNFLKSNFWSLVMIMTEV